MAVQEEPKAPLSLGALVGTFMTLAEFIVLLLQWELYEVVMPAEPRDG